MTVGDVQTQQGRLETYSSLFLVVLGHLRSRFLFLIYRKMFSGADLGYHYAVYDTYGVLIEGNFPIKTIDVSLLSITLAHMKRV